MIRAFYTARSGLIAHQENMNVISNNMANVNTVGFKGQRTSFSDLIYQNLNRPTAENPAMIGHGVRINKTDLIMSQGPLIPTNRTLDFALTNSGQFFAVQNAIGEVEFTRAGNFILSQDEGGAWFLATPNGDRVLDSEFEPIEIEFEQLRHYEQTERRVPRLDANGEQIVLERSFPVRDADGNQVFIDGVGQWRTEMVPQYDIYYDQGEPFYIQGQPIIDMSAIGIFRFDNPYGLLLLGDNRFGDTDLSGEAIGVEGARGIRQAMLEGSNVEIAAEMVRVIEANRAFSFSSRMIQIADEVENTVNTLR